MKKNLFPLLAIGLLLSAPLQSLAQEKAPMGPPKVLQIYREEVKPGKGTAHEKLESAYARAFAKAKWPTEYLAMTAVTGPGEVVFLSGYDSFAALEKDRLAIEKTAALTSEFEKLDPQESEFLSGGRSTLAVYREDLSYRPNVNVAQAHYMSVLTFRLRPGHEPDLEEAAKIVRGAYEKLNVDFHWAIFQVTSGAPGGTYLVFAPLKSLAEIDAARARSKALLEAEGEENVKKLLKIASDGYQSTEGRLYAFSPKMSYVSKEFASADPDFWTPKPKAAAKPAGEAKKERAKPAPAAKKQASKPASKQ